MGLKEHLNSLIKQRDETRTLYIKCEGAIEVLQLLIKEEESSKNKTKDKDDLEKNKN